MRCCLLDKYILEDQFSWYMMGRFHMHAFHYVHNRFAALF